MSISVRRFFSVVLACLLFLTSIPFQVLAESWVTGSDSKVNISLKYPQSTSADPEHFEYNAYDVDTVNVVMQVNYDTRINTFDEVFPVGSVSITIPRLLGLKPIVSETSHFAVSSYDDGSGNVVLTNQRALGPGSSGFFTMGYSINVREQMPNGADQLSQDNIKATVKATLGVLEGEDGDGNPVYGAGEVIEQQSGALSFLVHLKRDEFLISKTAHKVTSLSTIDVPDSSISEADYYMVNYKIEISLKKAYNIQLLEAEVRDVIPQHGVLLFVKGESGATYYNRSGSPAEQDSRLTYDAATRQLVVKVDGSKYNRFTTKPFEVLTVMVAFKKTDVSSQPNISNTADLYGYYKNETRADIAKLDTSTATVNIGDYGFIYGGMIYGLIKKTERFLSTYGANLSGNDLQAEVGKRIEFRLYPIVNDHGIGKNLIVRDDVWEIRDETGFYQLGAGDYHFTKMTISGNKVTASTHDAVKVSVLRAGQSQYQEIYSGLGREDLSFPYDDVIAIQVEYVNVKSAIVEGDWEIIVYGELDKTALHGKTTADKLRNLAMLDVYDPVSGQYLINVDESSYSSLETAEKTRLMQRDMNTYGKYVYRTNADYGILWDYLAPSMDKQMLRGQFTYDAELDALTGKYWLQLGMHAGSMALKNFTIVDILPMGVEVASAYVTNPAGWSADNILAKTPDLEIKIIDNYKNSGRQALFFIFTSDPNDDTQGYAPTQSVNNLQCSVDVVIRDYGAFLADSNHTVTNNTRFVLDDYEPGSVNLHHALPNDGSMHSNERDAVWIDVNGDGKNNIAADAFITNGAGLFTVSGLQDINKYVDTDQTDTFWQTKQATATPNTDFTYLLHVKASEGDMKNIIVFDELPSPGDQMYSPAGSRGSTFAPTLKSIDVSDASSKGFSPVIYVTESTTHSQAVTDSIWTKLSDYATPNDLSKVKAIAVDFGSTVLKKGDTLDVRLTMAGGDNDGKVAINTYYYFRDLDETQTGNWERNTSPLETNKVSVTVKWPRYQIGDRVFVDNNNNGFKDTDEAYAQAVSVSLYRVVNGIIETSAFATTTTNSVGLYSFSNLLEGDYVVKVELPSGYDCFSTTKSSSNTSIVEHYNAADQDGYTHIITLRGGDYLHADAGLVPTISLDFSKTADEPQVRLGGTASFTITGVENDNSFSAAQFILEDTPHAALNAKNIEIPAYINADGVTYTVRYKSNYATNWTMVADADNLSAETAQTVDIESVLQTGEKVTSIQIDFGTVPAQFRPVGGAGIRMVFNTSGKFDIYDDLPTPSDVWRMADNAARLSFTIIGLPQEMTDDAVVLVGNSDDYGEDPALIKKANDMYAALGGTTSFTINGVQNYESVNAFAFTLTDMPQAGLYFDAIHMPAFTNGSGVRYNVFYSTAESNTLIALTDAQNLAADQAQDIVFPAEAAGKASKLTIQFGTVPAEFAQKQPIVVDFRVDEDDSLFPDFSAHNDAELTYMANGEPVVLESGDDVFIGDLNVVKYNNPGSQTILWAGEQIEYTVFVENNGVSAYRNVQITDTVPAGTEYVAGSANKGGSYDADKNQITWIIDNLAPGERIEVRFRVKITQEGENLKMIQNVAYVDGKPSNEVVNVVDKVPPTQLIQAPKTGDSNAPVWLSMAMCLSGMAAMILLRKKKKQLKAILHVEY